MRKYEKIKKKAARKAIIGNSVCDGQRNHFGVRGSLWFVTERDTSRVRGTKVTEKLFIVGTFRAKDDIQWRKYRWIETKRNDIIGRGGNSTLCVQLIRSLGRQREIESATTLLEIRR
ncbi:hypothetical protein PV327_002147, partial [Microctonus hyperodae]